MGQVLKNWRAYLSGPIESASDDGVGWRQEFTRLNEECQIGLEIIDPTNKNDIVITEIGKERERLRILKKNREFEEVTSIMTKVRRWDLRAVDYSNIIIVKINNTTPTVGTVDEIVRAHEQEKPILAMVDGGPEQCHDWYFPMIRYNEMFYDVADLVEYLKRINDGKTGLDHRWIQISNN